MNTFQWCPLLKLLSSTIFLSICFCCCLHSVIEHLITDLKLPLTLIKIYRIAVRIHANASDAVICSCWQHMHCGHSCSKNFLLFLLIGNNNWWSSAAYSHAWKLGNINFCCRCAKQSWQDAARFPSTTAQHGSVQEHQAGTLKVRIRPPASHFHSGLLLFVPQFSLLQFDVLVSWGWSCFAKTTGRKDTPNI